MQNDVRRVLEVFERDGGELARTAVSLGLRLELPGFRRMSPASSAYMASRKSVVTGHGRITTRTSEIKPSVFSVRIVTAPRVKPPALPFHIKNVCLPSLSSCSYSIGPAILAAAASILPTISRPLTGVVSIGG
jgi:hypothetical protein